VCVCVCVRERERKGAYKFERERKRVYKFVCAGFSMGGLESLSPENFMSNKLADTKLLCNKHNTQRIHIFDP